MSGQAQHLPEADRIEGAPHPRETPKLFGHDAAEETFLHAVTGDRLHHAWLITGPRGIGKATFAWHMARFLLAHPPKDASTGLFDAEPGAASTTLNVDPEHPVARRILAGSEPGLFLLRRSYDEKTKKFRQAITVDEVRGLRNFFGLSATEGGYRVVIIDAADDMNVNAANALLKLLEEPPERAILCIISHQPARLLPTIRSRCRVLRLSALRTEDLTQALTQAGIEPEELTDGLHALSNGSVGAAIQLLASEGAALYAELVALFSALPRLERTQAVTFSNGLRGAAAQERFELTITMIELFLSRLARSGAGAKIGPEAASGERALFARLAPDADAARLWAEITETTTTRLRHGRAVNLDPAALILDTMLSIGARAVQISA